MSLKSITKFISVVAIVSFLSSMALAAAPTTHLDVTSSNLVTLSTGVITNDNTQNVFRFDGANCCPMGEVPEKHSLVVTDIIVEPVPLTPSTTNNYAVLVGVDGFVGRSFKTRLTGSDTRHYTFTAGLVIPEGKTLKALNFSTSAGELIVTVYGYLASGSGQPVSEPLF